jgi:2-polyprenyl-3-methyl-5-hydroxy-6-metoxy-1,4-benzoquinol methylase
LSDIDPTTGPEFGNDALVKSYNDVAYTSHPNAALHPDHLATIGTLLGLDVAPLSTCRVLELACGDGVNLLPIAATLPNATFVGVDFAARAVARAQDMARDLELNNVRLLQRDLRDLPPDLGSFDYIIAHGLYSWIPANVRAHVLPLIAGHLAPKGVAYVSYNTLPGCHMRRVVWEMLKYHTRALSDMPAKVSAARALLELVATPVDKENATQQAMRAEIRDARANPDSALAHDDLSEPNDPVHFHEFMADAARAGLTFLAESSLSTMMGGGLAPQVRQALAPMDRLAREQYLDFIYFRRFRESLLCHAGALSRFVVQPPRAVGMHVSASLDMRRGAEGAAPERELDPEAADVKRLLLARWPGSVPVAELAEWRLRAPSVAASGEPPRSTEMLVAELYVAGHVDLRTAPVAVATVAGERPEAFAAARWFSRERSVIPNLYHEALTHKDPVGRRLLALLDGTRTREQLAAAIGGPFSGPAGRAQLDDVLATLARKALLVA